MLPIALITGGYSKERSVSFQSADNVFSILQNQTQFQFYYIDVQEKNWYYLPKNSTSAEKIEVNKGDFSLSLSGQIIHFKAAIIILHGTPGEDGKIQSYLDMLDIPYLSCSAFTSALTMHKAHTNSFLLQQGILTPPFLFFHKTMTKEEINVRIATLSWPFPIFVKPNAGGSSIAMSKVKRQKDIVAALHKALAESNEAIIEPFIKGREFTIGIYTLEGKKHALPCSEIILNQQQDFFDFEAKYSGNTLEITPADISPTMRTTLENIAFRIYDMLHCSGIVRMDFIFEENTHKWYFLEVNTLPGQTAQSFIPQQINAANQNLKTLYLALLNEKITHHNQ